MNTKAHRFNVITITLSSMLGLGAAVAATSEVQAAEANARTVSYRDLDLSRPTDVQRLYQRLQHAAAEVCQQAPAMELARHLAYARCYRATLDSAVLDVRSPALLAVYRAAQSEGVPNVGG